MIAAALLPRSRAHAMRTIIAIKRGAGRKASGGRGRSWRQHERAQLLEGAVEMKKEAPACGPRVAVRERGWGWAGARDGPAGWSRPDGEGRGGRIFLN